MFVFELVGEDDAFAAYEAAAIADGVHRVAPGIALAREISPAVAQLGFTHRVGKLVGRATGGVASAREALADAPLDRSSPAAVRARAIRGSDVDTQAAEQALGSVLVERNFSIDLEAPASELRAVFSGGEAFLSWLVAEPGDDFAGRRPTDRPFFQPGSMSPRFARALVNIAGVLRGDRLLDPMCGTGGVVIEAGRVGARAVGIDAQRRMVAGTRRNTDALVPNRPVELAVADATRLPVPDGAMDAVVFDAPYGRQSRIAAADGDSLLAGALGEAARVADRAVVVHDRPLDELAAGRGWRVRARFSRRVHRSLTRHVHDLRRTR